MIRDLLGRASHDRELGCTLHQVDHRRAEIATVRRQPGFIALGQAAGEPGHHGGRHDEGDQQHRAGGREQDPHHGHGPRSDQRGDGERLDDPEHHVLERVDVVDDPRHEVAPAEERQPGRRHPFELLVDADPKIAEDA